MSEIQMSLGEMIATLQALNQSAYISIKSKVPLYPTKMASYRGYYNQLALGYDVDYSASQVTVGALLAECREALGRSFEGWKGGSYTMRAETPVWLDNPGCCNNLAIRSIQAGDEGFALIKVRSVQP